MNKKGWIIIIIVLVVLIIGGFWFYFSNKKNSDNNSNTEYEANRTSSSSPKNEKQENTNLENQNVNTSTDNTIQEEATPKYTEEQLSTFSTKIYSKDSARQNNIKITCNRLNGTTVKNGNTFSFCNTLGPSSTSNGYMEADIYDNNGNKKKGLRRWKLPSKYYFI